MPEEVPSHLFTQNKLTRMGLKPISEPVAWVYYPEQKRKYKLFDINQTKKRKQQSGMSFVFKDATIEQVLQERRNEMKIRREQNKE